MSSTPTPRASGARKRLPPSKVRRQLRRHLEAIEHLADERRTAHEEGDEWRAEQRTIELEQRFEAIHALQVAYPKHVPFTRAPEWLVGDHHRRPRRLPAEPRLESEEVHSVHTRQMNAEDLGPDRADEKSRATARL